MTKLDPKYHIISNDHFQDLSGIGVLSPLIVNRHGIQIKSALSIWVDINMSFLSNRIVSNRLMKIDGISKIEVISEFDPILDPFSDQLVSC